MAISIGDVIDEAASHDQSCRLAIKVLEGGAGFQQMNCCGNVLTSEHVSADAAAAIERFEGNGVTKGIIIDESKNYPNSCGLKVEVLGGGAGLESITCCGNQLTVGEDAV